MSFRPCEPSEAEIQAAHRRCTALISISAMSIIACTVLLTLRDGDPFVQENKTRIFVYLGISIVNGLWFMRKRSRIRRRA